MIIKKGKKNPKQRQFWVRKAQGRKKRGTTQVYDVAMFILVSLVCMQGGKHKNKNKDWTPPEYRKIKLLSKRRDGKPIRTDNKWARAK